MRVKCITTLINNPSVDLLKSGWWHAENYLTVGKKYDVYAFFSSYYFPGGDAFLVCDDNYNDNDYYWPLYIPTCFFDVIDDYKPTIWKISPDNPRYCGPVEIGPNYYENLMDGDTVTLMAFRRIRDLLMGKGRHE